MLADIRQVLDFTLFTSPGGQAVTVGQIVGVLLLLVFGYIASRIVGYMLGRRLATTTLRPDLIQVLKRIAVITILILVALTALTLLGIPLTAFAFATGAIAIGVGFGAQNIINNFISGWILMAERPIRIGDMIELDGSHGTVEVIGTRSTRIRRTDGVHMLVPNSQLLERTVVNWTLVDLEIRSMVRVGVAYGSPAKLVAELMLKAVTEQEGVKKDPEPRVIFEDFGDNALIFDAFFWADAGGERMLRGMRSSIRFRITELFLEHGIVIAFPQRDVHFDAVAPVPVRVVADDERGHAD